MKHILSQGNEIHNCSTCKILLNSENSPEVCLKFSQSHVNWQVGQIHLTSECVEHRLVEGVADVAEIFSDHLLGQTLPRHQEPRHGLGRVVQEALAYQIVDTLLWLLVEDVETSPVVSLPDHLVDGVVGVEHVLGSAGVPS